MKGVRTGLVLPSQVAFSAASVCVEVEVRAVLSGSVEPLVDDGSCSSIVVPFWSRAWCRAVGSAIAAAIRSLELRAWDGCTGK